MRKLLIVGVVASLAAATTVAFADKAMEKKKAAPPADKGAPARAEVAPMPPEPPPPMGPMAPAPELEQLKWMAANWNCNGKANDPSGAVIEYKSTMKGKWDVGKHWLLVTYNQKKAKGMPAPFTGKVFVGWSAKQKRFIFGGVDDWGGMVHLTSTGWDAAGKTMVFEGKAMMGEWDAPARFTFTKGDTDKQLTFVMAFQMQGQWVQMSEDTCKR